MWQRCCETLHYAYQQTQSTVANSTGSLGKLGSISNAFNAFITEEEENPKQDGH
jgi:hypothetical protein